jgi:hypothetical protein
MRTGTMHMGGFVAAGAARPGVCHAATRAITGQPGAPIHAYTQVDRGRNAKPESWLFATDRLTRRPLECFP